jgi:hypothetical protein
MTKAPAAAATATLFPNLIFLPLIEGSKTRASSGWGSGPREAGMLADPGGRPKKAAESITRM